MKKNRQHSNPSLHRRRSTNPKRTNRPSTLEQLQQLLHVDRAKNRESDGRIRTMASNRMTGIGALMSFFCLVLGLRAAQLMLLPNKRLEAQAQRQFEKPEQIEGRRGDIFDRNHDLLATSVTLWNLVLNPAQMRAQDIPEITQAIEQVFEETTDNESTGKRSKSRSKKVKKHVDGKRLASRIMKKKNSKWLVVLRKNHLSPLRLDPADIERLNTRLSQLNTQHKANQDSGFRKTLNAIRFQEHQYRFYPNMADGAPVLGWINREGKGVGGVEQLFHSTLAGEKFRVVSIRDRQNNDIYDPLLEQGMPKAQDGQSIVLSINRNIQHATDRAIKKAIKKTRAKAGFAVVMDVKTGEILAIANQPTINPNDRSKLNVKLLKNHAAVYAFEPGSVFKPLVAGVAIEEKIYSPNTLINCENGFWRVAGGIIRDDHPKGIISLTQVIQHSSNIGIGKVALKLGAKKVLRYLRDLGFGRYFEVRFPGSARGILRSHKKIKPIELITTSYGYGANSTLLQVASSFASLGNDGKRMKPLLMIQKMNSNEEIIEQIRPEVTNTIFSAKTSRQVIRMMEKVVTEGTALHAQVPGYRVAGKTGTAKKVLTKSKGYSKTDRIGSFVGLIPADNPRVAIAVSIDTPRIGKAFGGVVAAPAFSDIALSTMRSLGIPPDPKLLAPPLEEEEEVAEATQAIPPLQWRSKGKFSAPDLSGLSLRDALHVLSAANVNIKFSGSGRVANQTPRPGTLLASGDHVKVYLQ